MDCFLLEILWVTLEKMWLCVVFRQRRGLKWDLCLLKDSSKTSMTDTHIFKAPLGKTECLLGMEALWDAQHPWWNCLSSKDLASSLQFHPPPISWELETWKLHFPDFFLYRVPAIFHHWGTLRWGLKYGIEGSSISRQKCWLQQTADVAFVCAFSGAS